MGKKLIIIIVAIAVVAGGLYFFVFRDKGNDQAVYYDYAIKDPFITNVRGSNKLFKTTIILVIDNEKLSKELDKNLFTIRDTILFTMRSMTEEDIKNQSVQDNLRKTIPDKINRALNISGVVSVRFNDFVMQ